MRSWMLATAEDSFMTTGALSYEQGGPVNWCILLGQKSGRAILGYSQISSTDIYNHVSMEDLKEVVRRAHPHGGKKR